jgi:hypothetical protein
VGPGPVRELLGAVEAGAPAEPVRDRKIQRLRRLQERERDPGVHRDPVRVVDVEAGDTIDRCDGELQPFRVAVRGEVPRDHVVEVLGHQGLAAVRGGAFGCVDCQRGAALLDAACQLLGGLGAHAEVARVPPDDRVDGGER